MGVGCVPESTGQPSQREKARLAREVKRIFEKKCAKCHTPDGSERKKYDDQTDIDFILNLEKLASDPDIIVRGDPRGSWLFLQVDDDSMPFSDVKEDPLPMDEKRLIERWIMVGAPNEKGE